MKQEVIESQEIDQILIDNIFSIKREYSPTEDVQTDASVQASSHEANYDEIKIEEFDIDKALLQRAGAVSVEVDCKERVRLHI